MQYMAREEGFQILRHFDHGSKAGTQLLGFKAIEGSAVDKALRKTV